MSKVVTGSALSFKRASEHMKQIAVLVSTLLVVATPRACVGFRASSHLPFRPSSSVVALQHNQQHRISYRMAATTPAGPAAAMTPPATLFQPVVSQLKVLWDFGRPHTLIGSAVSLVALFLFATPQSFWSTREFGTALLSAMVPAMLMNLYITGLNQVTDVEIDIVNKPYLPIAAGKLSKLHGTVVVVASLLGSLWSIRRAQWPLQGVVVGSGVLGTLYSLPPFRLKRFPFLAAMCILVVRGSLVNLGFFFQAKAVWSASVSRAFPASLAAAVRQHPESLLLTAFFAIFGVVIALMKDVPDVEGDRQNDIKSFAVRLGAGEMFKIAQGLLTALLAGSAVAAFAAAAAAAAATAPPALSGIVACRTVLGVAMALLAVTVRGRALAVNAAQPKEVFSHYMHVWNVFYGCYLLLPLVR